ncbi:mannitol dehydrogenase family protein [Roseitranquillus sediminis]|uniref:mannitol dehydrogenase family protein n=1 Tax=Roseitranquillus sediminis TaxID=2809051 RepID=UPI001D0C4E65|nr:mannitol dehydrogenase family protein [Roseitranquillus sediminis]
MTDLPRLIRSGLPHSDVGIVHVGLGAFFRAHGALYVAEAMEADGGDWGIVGVSLRSPGIRDRLSPQDFVYTAVELGPDGKHPRVVEVVRDVLVAPEDPEAVLRRMADPGVRIVSLTVTEKGYCHHPASGRLNREHPDIRHDVEHPKAPRSAPGFLVRALERRCGKRERPFTVLCCDNLPKNGPLVRGVILELAEMVSPELADWIAREVRFPATMVDRIVPAVTDEDVRRIADLTGRYDAAPVLHEPFRQWVVEDDFVDGARPTIERAGAQIVSDVEPFELMKLRCLNGAHSALAYLGFLAGHETIADAVADPVLADFVQHLWREEVIPTLQQPEDVDLAAYTKTLLERFANPAIRHRTSQIAMDGSQKLPQRILGPISDNLEADRSIDGLSLVVAAWMRYVGGVDEAGGPIEVSDPMAARLRQALDHASTGPAKVDALLGIADIFSPKLAEDRGFRTAVTAAYDRLTARGARRTVQDFAAR